MSRRKLLTGGWIISMDKSVGDFQSYERIFPTNA